MKRIRLAALLLALLMVLSACGNNTTNNTPNNSGNGGGDAAGEDGMVTLPITGAQVDAAVFDEPFTINYAAVRSGGSDAIAEMFEKLNELPGCTATSRYFGATDLDTQMNLALTAGDGNSPYDLFRVSLRNYRDFMGRGLLMDMSEYMEKYADIYNFEDVPESMWAPLEELGNISGLPLTVSVQHIYYRTDIFEQYNLTPPETLDDLIEICEVLQDCEEISYPIALCLDKGNGAATEYTNMMYGAGVDFFDENEYPTFNGPEGVECLERLLELTAYCPPSATSMTNDDIMVLMQTGEVAMILGWDTRAPYFEDETVSSVVGKVGYSHSPLYAEGKYPLANLSVDYLVVPANIPGDPEETFLAVAELASEEAQTSYLSQSFVSRQAPASLYEGELLPNTEAVNETVALGAQVGHYHPAFGYCWSIISNYVAMAIDGEMTAQEALDQAAAECVVTLTDLGLISE